MCPGGRRGSSIGFGEDRSDAGGLPGEDATTGGLATLVGDAADRDFELLEYGFDFRRLNEMTDARTRREFQVSGDPRG